MPILQQNKHLYPDNWNDISKDIRFNRAKNRCEVCGVFNYAVGKWVGDTWHPTCGNAYHDAAGRGDLRYKDARFLADHCNEWLDEKLIVIVLTVAHLDHNPNNCNYSNLLAMCQRCHNRNDRKHRNITRKERKLKGQYLINF